MNIFGFGIEIPSTPQSFANGIQRYANDEFTGGALHGTLVDTQSIYSQSGGILAASAPTHATRDPRLYYSSRTRAHGLAIKVRGRQNQGVGASSTPEENPFIGFNVDGLTNWYGGYGFLLTVSGAVNAKNNNTGLGSAQVRTNVSHADWHVYTVILRETGMFLVVDNELLWIGNSGNQADVVPAIISVNTNRHPFEMDYVKVGLLPVAWRDDNTIATSITTSPAINTPQAHTTDFSMDFVVGTLPSSGSMRVLFSYADASNFGEINMTSGGVLSIRETIGGVDSGAVFISGGVSNGMRIHIRRRSNNVRIWTNNTYRNNRNYTVAGTSARVLSYGSGTPGTIPGNISCWPVILTGQLWNGLNAL